MAELICNVVVKSFGDKIKAKADFPLYVSNLGECQALADILKLPKLLDLIVRPSERIPATAISSAVLQDGQINGKLMRAQIYNGLVALRNFVVRNRDYKTTLTVRWGNEEDVELARFEANKMLTQA